MDVIQVEMEGEHTEDLTCYRICDFRGRSDYFSRGMGYTPGPLR